MVISRYQLDSLLPRTFLGMFRSGTILNDTWEIKRRIGQGSFCELFLARNIIDRNAPLVAIKAQNDDIEASIIRVEGALYAGVETSLPTHSLLCRRS